MSDMLELLKNDAKLKFVLKEFPVLGEGSMQAAQVAAAVRMQDKSGGIVGIEESLALHRQVASAILRGDDSAARVAMENVILHAARLIYHVTDPLGNVQQL